VGRVAILVWVGRGRRWGFAKPCAGDDGERITIDAFDAIFRLSIGARFQAAGSGWAGLSALDVDRYNPDRTAEVWAKKRAVSKRVDQSRKLVRRGLIGQNETLGATTVLDSRAAATLDQRPFNRCHVRRVVCHSGLRNGRCKVSRGHIPADLAAAAL